MKGRLAAALLVAATIFGGVCASPAHDGASRHADVLAGAPHATAHGILPARPAPHRPLALVHAAALVAAPALPVPAVRFFGWPPGARPMPCRVRAHTRGARSPPAA